jgi:hypothetical protein
MVKNFSKTDGNSKVVTILSTNHLNIKMKSPVPKFMHNILHTCNYKLQCTEKVISFNLMLLIYKMFKL